jgi:hypothetical protein
MTLTVRIKKKTDGGAALSCTRADGSVTWQPQNGKLGAFFPLHDLTHFAVESVLGFENAFYGLVSKGWDISRFEQKGMEIPAEALLTEVLVAFLDLERATGVLGTADDFNWKLDTYHDEHGLPHSEFRMTDEKLAGIRAKRSELFERWRAVPAGETLELQFR